MKRIRNTMLVSLYILLVAVAFSGAYVIGRTGTSTKKDMAEPETEEAVETVSESGTRSPEYEVIAEDGKIIIYKCIGEIKSVVTSEKISEGVFPAEDMAELKKGVKFERLENAQQMFENFVS